VSFTRPARRIVSSLALVATGVLALALPTRSALAQGGVEIRGTVTNAQTSAPIVGASVTISGTRYGALTNDQGRYVITGVDDGTYVVEARRLGYGIGRRDRVRVSGEPVTVDITMNTNALSLEAVTVAATLDPTSGIKAPFAVSTITKEMMPVLAPGAATVQLIGKVAGVHVIQASGAPGSGSFVQLRTPSSVLKGNGPLYVIDGILLNETQQVITQDIETMNIESIEIIKGAAAAAMYGSRAAGGVIAIKTKRGKDVALGSSQITIRNDFGYDQFHDRPQKRQHHHYRVNAQGQFVDATGAVVPRASRTIDPDGMIDNPYPVVYDNIGQLFTNGRSMVNQVSIAQNSAGTNYTLSFTRNRQPGVIKETDGYLRQQAQFTIDHSLRDNLTIAFSANHSRASNVQDEVSFGNLYAYDPDVNLTMRDANGFYFARPDSASTITNPMYLQQVSDNRIRRARTLISSTGSYRPFTWLTLNGDVGYDRGDLIEDFYTPPGVPDDDGSGVELGSLRYDEDETDGMTGSLGATAMRDFRKLTARLTTKAEMQRERNLFFSATGTDFQVQGIRDMSGALTRTNTSSITDRRINAGIAALGLDYDGRYIADILLRREGNSLFGRDHRWTTFYRVGGSYLTSSESWWPKDGILGNLTTFKVRYNVGTAGTRPSFNDQYTTITVGSQGFVRDELGNPNLSPEIKMDHEAGIDMIIRNRLQVMLTYARSRTRDAIIGIAAPSVTGFNTQNANVGSTVGETMEATIEGAWIERPNFKWSTNFVFDRSTANVEKINRPCYTEGIRYYCDGSPLAAMWGQRLVRSLDELRSVHASSRDLFQINDHGFVVPVGAGNTWQEGISKSLWGTTLAIDGVTYRWGEPILVWDEAIGASLFHRIGDGTPDFRFGLGNRFNYKSFQLYFLLAGQLGGQVYNNVRQNLIASLDEPEVVQAGKPDELKKPYYYYSRGFNQNNNFWLQHFLESGTHAKLYELQLSYEMTPERHRFLRVSGAERIQLQLIGRNLATWSNYSGLRVEGGSPNYRVDDTDYPITRNFSASISLVY
jgi:TonB-linked SusC/RagA family outer membrane protein